MSRWTGHVAWMKDVQVQNFVGTCTGKGCAERRRRRWGRACVLKVKWAGSWSFPVTLGPATGVTKLFSCFLSFTCYMNCAKYETNATDMQKSALRPDLQLPGAQVTRDSQHAYIASCFGTWWDKWRNTWPIVEFTQRRFADCAYATWQR
jgi:hypothetical protein